MKLTRPEMYRILAILGVLNTVDGASYQYESTTYRNYQPQSTISNLYQYPYNTGRYGVDSGFPEATRYPNYSPGSTYSTQRPGYNNYQGVYSTQGYPSQNGNNYGNNYGSNYGNRNSYGNSYGRGYSSYEQPFMRDIRDYCVNRSPQMGIWVDSLMGMWYGVEFIQHLGGDSRVDYAQTCIVIHIAEPMERPSTENQLFHVAHINAKFRQEYRHLRLLWDEAGQTIEYALYFRNDSAGYWQVFDGQNGTLPSRSSYQQFSGTIQVIKAVNDHLVLNFCQEAVNGKPAQLYSVLFSREPGQMARWELDSVHTMLQNKKLSVASRRMVCGNSADKPLYSLVLSILLVAINYSIAL